MRLILLDIFESRRNFYPLAFSRPLWELRCGILNLAQKLQAACAADTVAGFAPTYMAACQGDSPFAINNLAALDGDDLLLVNARLRPQALADLLKQPSAALATPDGELLFARVDKSQAQTRDRQSIDAFIKDLSPATPAPSPECWNFIWDLVDANAGEIDRDFVAAGRGGQGAKLDSQISLRGNARDVYIAPDATVCPMVMFDTSRGPIYIDSQACVEAFTQIEGPCYIGPHARLLGARCRSGNSIGPHCRIGGEIEASIMQGYSNKYHDGFLGHAYVGQWVNLGALTCNSDLRNDYRGVTVRLDERGPLDTGLMKFGSLIGDHAKTSIGTLLNTGAYVGAFGMMVTDGELAPRFIPSFGTYLRGVIGEGFKREHMFATARTVLQRRNHTWTSAMEAMWNSVYEMTAAHRKLASA